MQKRNNFRKPPVKQRRHKINSEVRFPQVRLVGDSDNKIISSYEASKLAEAEGLDLILINESSNPPIVKIDDYNKFIYNLEKLEKERKKNANKSETKEMQLSVDIGENDLKTKSRKCLEFLEDGDKVRCVLQLKGRQKAMPERGEIVMLKMLDMLCEVGEPEFLPKLENGKWVSIVKPRKRK